MRQLGNYSSSAAGDQIAKAHRSLGLEPMWSRDPAGWASHSAAFRKGYRGAWVAADKEENR